MCDTAVAVGMVTASGHVVFAKNSDRHPNECHAPPSLAPLPRQPPGASALPVPRDPPGRADARRSSGAGRGGCGASRPGVNESGRGDRQRGDLLAGAVSPRPGCWGWTWCGWGSNGGGRRTRRCGSSSGCWRRTARVARRWSTASATTTTPSSWPTHTRPGCWRRPAASGSLSA